ncbi:MAG TPA: hypothetical protein VFZ81_00415 [Burkholderiales bacterium]
MSRHLFLAFLLLGSNAVAGDNQGGASAGASSESARARAGANASVEGGAALGVTGVDTRPAVKAEQAEKDERRRRRAAARAERGEVSGGATGNLRLQREHRDSRPGSREAEESR